VYAHKEEEDATPIVPVGGTSGTAVVSAAKMVAAAAAATSISTVSSGQPSYQTLRRSDEEKEEVYGPGSASSNPSDHGSCEEEDDVHHSEETMVPVDEVRVYVFIVNALYPIFGEEETDHRLTCLRSAAKSPEKLTVREYYHQRREAAEAALHQSADEAVERAPVI
jgi:hypothetical protein